ncbi:MAG: ATP-binding cassette domain-containing protein [Oscillospiraceae bacterium]
MKPRADFKPEGKPKNTFYFVKKRLEKAKAIIPLILLLYSVSVVVNLLTLILNQVFLDNVMSGISPEWEVPLGILMAACLVLRFFVMVVERVRRQRFCGALAVESGSNLVKKLYRAPLQFFEQHFAGELLERIQSNDNIDRVILGNLLPLAIDGIMLIGYFVLMYQYNVVITIVCISIEIAYVVATVLLQKRIENLSRMANYSSGNMNAVALNGINTIETIKSMGAEGSYFRQWSLSQSRYQQSQVRLIALRKYLSILSGIHDTLSAGALIFIGASFISQGMMSMGMIASIQSILQIVRSKTSGFIQGNSNIQTMGVDIERIDEVMETKTEPEIPLQQDAEAEKLSGTLEINHLSFSYNGEERKAVNDFSLTVRPGSFVALVGPTGCGKSTVFKLIANLYTSEEGSIKYGGLSRTEIPDVVFYSSLAVVDQEINFFADSLSNNLRMWDSTIPSYEMILGARDAQVHKMITARVGGYNTPVQEGGKNFSGGERQRLEIARALAQEPTILLLDEATSALDAVTEEQLVKAIRNRGLTCIMVAHRLSTVRDCDEILVMQKGNVVQRGKHDELISKDGLYKQLVESREV